MEIGRLDLNLRSADLLLIVPPFAHLTWPSIGVHVLQGIAREEGLEAQVMYGNMQFAAMIGHFEYAELCNQPTDWLLGERIFRQAAYELPPLGNIDRIASPSGTGATPTAYLDQLSDATGERFTTSEPSFTRDQLEKVAAQASQWADAVAAAIVQSDYKLVGATTMFEQTSAAIAILKRIKQRNPNTITLLGGANCEGEMGKAMAELTNGFVDHLFSGESEGSFRQFLSHRSSDRLCTGQPLQDMDSLPRLDYDDYFQQMGTLIPDLKDVPVWLYYETSRGCWWGAKHHCTFCGLNANGMAFRERSPDKVVDELRTLTQRYPSTKIAMTDNIMPFRYHKTLIPKLANELPELHIFYEQKANLTLDQVNGLYKAGNVVIQPGIESLSTELLTLMRKGVRAWQNIALLRYARAVGMGIKWNLLYSFPNDTIEPYQEMLELIPKINHLTPPNALTHLSIDRFSPYFEQPDEFGLERIEPLTGYRDIFPEECDVEKLAYHFTARYRSASRESAKLMWQLYEAVTTWQDAWKNGENESPPMLHVQRRQDSSYLLYDTRAGSRVYNLNAAQAEAALIGGPIDSVPMAKWAIHNRFAVHLDDRCVPLATANYETLSRLERKRPVHQESLTQLQRLH